MVRRILNSAKQFSTLILIVSGKGKIDVVYEM